MDTKQKVFLVIDGHAMAYRAYFAMLKQNLTNQDGMPTGAIHGFFRMILKLIEEKKPDYFLFVFDPPRKTFREEMYPEYKATRAKTDEELKWQIDEIQSMIQDLGLPMHIPEKEEADDFIASLAEKINHSKKDILLEMVSGDKDLYNVISPQVHLLRSKKGVTEFEEIDPEKVIEITGVQPDQIPDYMALTGDSSDNIPGVKGVGPKTAAKLISEFGSLENLYQNLDKVKPDSLKEKLAKNKDNAFLSYQLVQLKKDLKLPDDFSKFLLTLKPGQEKVFLKRGFETLAKSWRKFVTQDDSAETTTKQTSMDQDNIGQNNMIIKTKSHWIEFWQKAQQADLLCIDTETTSVSPLEADLLGISLAYRKGKKVFSCYVPIILNGNIPRHLDYAGIDFEALYKQVQKDIRQCKIPFIAQNIKYDYLVLERHDIKIKNFYADTMILSYLLNPGVRKHNLDDLALEYLGHENITYKSLVGTGKKQKLLSEIDLDRAGEYAAEDAEVTLRVYEKILPRVQKENLWDLYRKIDHPLIFTLAEMEKVGMKIDVPYLHKLKEDFSKKLETIRQEIYDMAGEEFNIQSTRELQHILFDKLGITSVKKTETGQKSTDVHSLESVQEEHPIIPKILEYRTLAKLISGYVDPLPSSVGSDGRVHTSFSQVTAATGRLASSNPNLQNIPAQGEEGKMIRKAFIAEDGFLLLSLDYSQIELRLLAHYSEDKALVKAFQQGEDIHDHAAYYLFRNMFDAEKGVWLDTPQPEFFENSVPELDKEILHKMKQTDKFASFRRKAKILNYSIIYGVTDYGLSRNLNIPRSEAKLLIEAYFKSYPGVKKYLEKSIEQAKEKGYVENYFGRRRILPDIKTKNRFARQAAERLAMNTPLQSTAADIIKIAMIKIEKRLKKKKSRMIMQIHDELVFEVAKNEKDEVYQMAKYEMEHVGNFKVPLLVDGGFGANWAEAK
ncbi:MAG: DNA polymerase I [Candidatus Hydrogenedentota bacterium]|nr:MAG: DNA polymerase I [Candidatus Hydrogenedentota bacterium]